MHFPKYDILIKTIQDQFNCIPDISIVLGSGLGNFANSVEIIKSLDCNSLPDYPQSTIVGHSGKLILAKHQNKTILLFQGRFHFYEGYSLQTCLLPVYIAFKLGCQNILITNAAGGINKNLYPGALMLNTNFLGFNIKKEFMGIIKVPNKANVTNFLNIPSKKLGQLTIDSALNENIKLNEGSYYYAFGPSYETPAEIQMMKSFGADAVGMSTVHEAYFAGYLGMEIVSISCITNFASGLSSDRLSHSEVTDTAKKIEEKFERLVKRIIADL